MAETRPPVHRLAQREISREKESARRLAHSKTQATNARLR